MRTQKLLGLVAVLTALTAAQANAGFTTIAPGGYGEPDLLDILDDMYGLENLERIHDHDNAITDEVWMATGDGSALAKAKFAGYDQNFGYMAGGGFESLFMVDGNGMLAGAEESIAVAAGDVLRFANDTSGSPMWSSERMANADELDHMVTWRVVGSDNGFDNQVGAYVVAWEDLWGGGDNDYQDLVVELTGVTPGGEPVPEPTTIALFGLGAMGMGLRRRFRKKTQDVETV